MANYGGFQLPKISENSLDEKKERKQILNYLALLDEKLRYMFQNIDIEENLSEDSKNYLFRQGEAILNVVKDVEGNFSLFRQDLDGFLLQVENVEGSMAALQLTADGLATRVASAEKGVSEVRQTATSITSRVTGLEGEVSEIRSDLDGITLSYSSSTGKASITIGNITVPLYDRDGVSELVSDEVAGIELTGYVQFTDLSKSGYSTINGNNITTGNIDTSSITLDGDYGGFSCARGNNGSTTTYGAMMYSDGGDSYFIATDSGVRMTYDGEYAVYCTSAGVTLVGDYDFRAATNFYCMSDDSACLGTSSRRWDIVYATTGTINTSDEREKNSISYDMTEHEKLFDLLKPTPYKMNSGTSDRLHIGFIAQDVEKAMEEIGMDSKDFAGFVKSPVYAKELESGEFDTTSEIIDHNYALRYSEFTALNTHMIQKLMARVTELENKLEALS